MKLKLTIFFSIFFLTDALFAQLEMYPLYSKSSTPSLKTARTLANSDTLKLPFDENFTSLSTEKNWIENNGVYINNHFAANQPSIGVATLDGVKGIGEPYVFLPDKSSAAGIGDYMTSKCINLLGYNKTDSVAFSFFWQQGTPHDFNRNPLWDKGERLRIYFKDSLENFTQVWPTPKIVKRILATGKFRDTFYLENILLEPIYFHNGFQIKLEYYGTLAGNYGVFNVDNLYLNRGIAKLGADTTFVEQLNYSFSQSPSKLLTPYSSVPVSHFKSAGVGILSDTIKASMYTLDKLFAQDTDSSIVISNNKNESVLLKDRSDELVDRIIKFKKAVPTFIHWTPDKSSLKANIDAVLTDTTVLKTTVSIITPSSVDIPESTSSLTVLSNYYAFDDGTMEAGLGVRGVGEFVQSYDFIKGDSVNGFLVYFPKYGLNLEGLFLKYNVYASLQNIDGKTETKLLLSQNGVVEYDTSSNTLNKFVFIPFSKSLVVSAGRYYFGISQDNDKRILLGLDYSNNRADNIFYRKFSDDPWESFASNDGFGCVALRPVIGRFIAGPQTAPEARLGVSFHPNPSNDKVEFNDSKVDKVILFTRMGTKVAEINVYNREFSVRGLEKDSYIMQIYSGEEFTTQKIHIE